MLLSEGKHYISNTLKHHSYLSDSEHKTGQTALNYYRCYLSVSYKLS